MAFDCKESSSAVRCGQCGKWMLTVLADNLRMSVAVDPEYELYLLIFDCPVCLANDQFSFEYYSC